MEAHARRSAQMIAAHAASRQLEAFVWPSREISVGACRGACQLIIADWLHYLLVGRAPGSRQPAEQASGRAGGRQSAPGAN